MAIDTTGRQSSAPKRVLVVDDDLTVLLLLERFLRNMGYYVVKAQGGAVAIDAYRRYEFDLVLTDLDMPDVDGRALIGALSREFPDIKVVVVSGHIGADGLVELPDTAAIVGTIPKPFDYGFVEDVVKAALQQSPPF